MNIFYGYSKKKYILYPDYSWFGGEGYIYEIKNEPNLVAKVLKEKFRTEDKKAKLRLMFLNTDLSKLEDSIIWPQDLLYKNNEICGFVMKKLTNAELLNEIYSDRFRKSLNWDIRIRLALNLAVSVNSIHSVGYVIGDFNPYNVMIGRQDGRSYLIDTDSFHIRDNRTNKLYPCVAATESYWAPEIFNRLVKTPLPYSKTTDNFALAIHIFRILMEGNDPFQCRITGNVKPLYYEDCIKMGFSPYLQSKKGYDIPLGAPQINILPEELKELFQRAFVTSINNPQLRPSALDWAKVLYKECTAPNTNTYPVSDNKLKKILDLLRNMIKKPLVKTGLLFTGIMIAMVFLFGVVDMINIPRATTKPNDVPVVTADTKDNPSSDGNIIEENIVVAIPSDAFVWNGHSYYIFNNVADYLGAKRYCESRGGYLATIGSKAENDAIYSYIRSKDIKTAYFGLTDEKKEGVWTWVNGEKLTYTNWHRDEPNGGTSENHAMFYYKYPDGKWNDENLSKYTVESERYFICEWDGVNQKQVDNKVNVIENASTQPEYNKSKVKIVPEPTEIKVVTTNPVSKKKRLIGSDEYNEFARKYKPTNDIGSKKYLEIGETAYLYSESAFKAYNTATFKEEMKIVNNVRLIQRAVKIEDRRNIAPFGKAILKDDIKGEFFNTSGVYKLYNVKDDTPCEVAHKINGEYFCGFTMNGELWCKWIKEDKLKPDKKEFWYEINIPGDNTNDTYWVSGLYLSKLKKRK